jgi:hypothetical protein
VIPKPFQIARLMETARGLTTGARLIPGENGTRAAS